MKKVLMYMQEACDKYFKDIESKAIKVIQFKFEVCLQQLQSIVGMLLSWDSSNN